MELGEALRVLGLTAGATKKEVTAAFKRAALILHPDKDLSGDPERAAARFVKAKQACDILLSHLEACATGAGVGVSNSGRPKTTRGPSGPAPPPPSASTSAAAFASFKVPLARRKGPSSAAKTSAAKSQQRQGPVRKETAVTRGVPGHRSSQPFHRHIDRWGVACGGCTECRRAAAVPRDVVSWQARS